MLDERKTARLEARCPVSVYALLKEAAELQGRTLSDFVVASAREAAEQAVVRDREIQLSLEDQEAFADALLNPPKVATALKKAAAARDRLLDPS